MQYSRRGTSGPARPRLRRRRLGYAAVAVAGLLILAACSQGASSASGDSKRGGGAASKETSTPSAAVAVSPVVMGKEVIADEPLVVTARGGKLTSVAVATRDGTALEGKVSADGGTWTSTRGTEYGTTYTLKAQLAASDGSKVSRSSSFTTVSKKDIFVGTYNVSQGSTVGVALPVSVVFNKPVRDKAAVERGLSVTASPAVEGSWSWMKDRDGKDRVDYRPQEYWKPGTEVRFGMNLVGVKNGGLVGTQKREVDFTVGKSVTTTVDVVKKTLTLSENSKAVRTIPVSAGKKDFETWNGTMVVLSKVPTIRMNSRTVGIFGPEAYDLGAVKWDVQLTPSGTYTHAAPWNEGKFGKVNGSHGCIGMSTADAKWFFQRVNFGDPVTVVNSKDTVAVNNGYGDWNVDWNTWKKGSALS
ncbi:L,D-transpeptidase family protein (plasmid) [Streptomyces mirabilis]|uniref:L,D-transpeptidase n=1 Tax=Streptomyces mirabilis TaxID=68239 RepID=UPI001BAF8E38|nr:Ig-like domain-containing protein [Streptomyces mirabilis]QUW85544.1 L,D-transpeptidase family protein [Streptomyces mirabilis]